MIDNLEGYWERYGPGHQFHERDELSRARLISQDCRFPCHFFPYVFLFSVALVNRQSPVVVLPSLLGPFSRLSGSLKQWTKGEIEELICHMKGFTQITHFYFEVIKRLHLVRCLEFIPSKMSAHVCFICRFPRKASRFPKELNSWQG